MKEEARSRSGKQGILGSDHIGVRTRKSVKITEGHTMVALASSDSFCYVLGTVQELLI